jgi:membrane protein required for beta-lactamase induction
MILLAMVFALMLDSLVPHVDQYRIKTWHWLEHNALQLVSRGFPASPLVLTALVILTMPLLLLLIRWLLPDAILLTLVFETIVLWFSLGPRSLYQELQSQQGHLTCSSVLRWRNKEQKESEQQLVSEAFYRLFLPLFWFVIGGAVLASLVRSLVIFCDQHDTLRETDEHALIKLINWVMLLPAWVLAASFGLMGRLHETWNCWREQQQADQDNVVHRLSQFEQGLSCTAKAAIGENVEPSALLALLKRTLVAWIALVALFTLGGVLA